MRCSENGHYPYRGRDRPGLTSHYHNGCLTPMPIDTQQALSTSADVESNYYPAHRTVVSHDNWTRYARGLPQGSTALRAKYLLLSRLSVRFRYGSPKASPHRPHAPETILPKQGPAGWRSHHPYRTAVHHSGTNPGHGTNSGGCSPQRSKSPHSPPLCETLLQNVRLECRQYGLVQPLTRGDRA